MTKGEYEVKLRELIEVGLYSGRNRELTPPLNNTVSIGMIKPFIGLVTHLAMNWKSDKDGKNINKIINDYKHLV